MNLVDVQKLIDEKINPIIALHKGKCELVSITDEGIHIRLTGGCVGCPSSTITLYNGIIPIIQEVYPEVEVLLV